MNIQGIKLNIPAMLNNTADEFCFILPMLPPNCITSGQATAAKAINKTKPK
jgi:hypothetical protein